ncbi:MAG: response regulator [Candidatus Methylomirabilia bacterium]
MALATILVVDDDRKNLKIVGAYLKAAGYEVEFAHDGEEALEKIRDCAPNLIVLDVFMPAMSGLELSDALKSDPQTRGIPILAMSSYHDYAAGAPRLDLPADDFLKKPVRMDHLLEKVGKMLRRPGGRQKSWDNG